MSRSRVVLALLCLAVASGARAQGTDEGTGEEVKARIEWERARRAFPKEEIPLGARQKSLRDFESLRAGPRPLAGPPLTWTPLGPAPITNGQMLVDTEHHDVSGRVISLAVDPTNPKHWFAGAAQGGIWQTTDRGATWTTNTDALPSLSIGALAISTKSPNVIYAGTGEAYFTFDAYDGAGILRSTDGGTTWTQVGGATFANCRFSAILVNPFDEKDVRVAVVRSGRGATNGVLHSTDSGDHWTQERAGSTTDLVTPGFSTAYAGFAGEGVFRRTDDAHGFVQVANPWGAALPAGAAVGRIALAIAPTRSDRLYVAVEDAGANHNNDLLGLFYTDNAWVSDPAMVTWTRINTSGQDTMQMVNGTNVTIHGFCQKQCFYDMVLHVDAGDENVLYAGGISMWRCTHCADPAALSWVDIGRTGTNSTHPDQHALVQADPLPADGPLTRRGYLVTQETYCADGNPNRVVSEAMPFTSLPPCNEAYSGTFHLTGTFSVPDQPLTGYEPYPNVRDSVRLATPLDVTFTMSGTLTVPAGTGQVTDVKFHGEVIGDSTCSGFDPNARNKVLNPGETINLSLNITCKVSTLYDQSGYFGTSRIPYPTVATAAYYYLEFQHGLSEPRSIDGGVYALWSRPPRTLVVGNDGGVFSTKDGSSWADHNETLSITQFFSGSAHPQAFGFALGGSQDNGTEMRQTGDAWKLVVGGDGGDVHYAGDNPDHFGFVVVGNNSVRRSLDGGATSPPVPTGLGAVRLPFFPRLAKCPTTSDVFLVGTAATLPNGNATQALVFRNNTFFSGATPAWTQNIANAAADGLPADIQAIAFAPAGGCSTYAAASTATPAFSGDPAIALTTDAGGTWRRIGGAAGTTHLPNRTITELAFDATSSDVLWVSFQGFDAYTPGRAGHLFRTENALVAPPAQPNWADVTPKNAGGTDVDVEINAVLLDAANPGTVYIGTDFGVLMSTNNGTDWMELQGLPRVAVDDLVQSPTGGILAFTHGRGAFRLEKSVGDADLFVTKTANHDPATACEPLTYTITVKNLGPGAATNVTVSDDVPAGASLVSAEASQGGCSGSSSVFCTLGTIANGASATVTIVVIPRQPGTITNKASAHANERDTNASNNDATVSVEVSGVCASADRAVAKTHTPEPITVGGRVTWTVTVTNNGPNLATGTEVVDTLPLSITDVAATPSQGSCSGTQVVTCFLGNVAVGGTATITITGKASEAGSFANQVSVTGNESDPNPANDFARDPMTVVAFPAIAQLVPPSAPQGTRALELKILGANFEPGAVVSFQPPDGIEVVPGTPPSYGFVSTGELHQFVNIAAGAPLGEREVHVTNPDGRAGGIRPTNVFTVTPGAFGSISVAPASLDFGSVLTRQTKDKLVTITNVGTGNLKVRAAGSAPPFALPGLAVPFDLAAGAHRDVTVRFAPRRAGNAAGVLVISSDDAAHPSVTVPLTGTATAPPILHLSPAALNFGTVATGDTRALTMKIKNDGGSPLTVTSLSSSVASISAPLAVPATVPPGGSVDVNVTFAPVSAGVVSASLTLASNDPDQPSAGVQIKGEGAAPPASESLVIDDGSIESGVIGDGLMVVNRFTPQVYPARLTKISVFFYPFQSLPSPSGAPIRLIAYADASGGGATTQHPQLLLDRSVTVPQVPANGAYFDFDVPDGPMLASGDVYAGFTAPSPAGGVAFAADTSGVQKQRGFFSTDGGASFVGPLVISGQSGQVPANIMIRATTASGSPPSPCTWGIEPAKIDIPKEGGTGTIAVTAPEGCPWDVTASAPFVSFGPAARRPLVSGTGSGTVHYTVEPATSDADRSATITIASLDAAVAQSTSTPSDAYASDVFVPIVLSTAGLNGSFFTSELTITNRGTTSAVLKAAYAPAFGGGGGAAYDVLAPGVQRVFGDGLQYLKSIGTPLPDTGNRGGTLTLSFSDLSSPSAGAATVRTTTSVPGGRAGLAYGGVPSSAALTGPVYLLGLRQNATDRSNLALQNAGTSGDVVLRVTVSSGDAGAPVTAILPDIGLAPGGFAQITGVLAANGLALTNGFARVERVGGTAPFDAYAVINDQANSDGSFVPAVSPGSVAGRSSLAVPVIVETATFLSEVVLTNFGTSPRTVHATLVSDALTSADKTATFTTTLAPSQQLILPSFVQYLRDHGVAGVPAAGTNVVGPLFLTADGGDVAGLFVGARTSSAGGGGRYGLFYTGVPSGGAATHSAWLYGLRQDAENRTNVAFVNTGEVDGGGCGLRLDIYDGDTGTLVKTVDGISVAARRQAQLTTVLSVYAPGVTNAYAKVTRTAGKNPFIAYAVVNDGGAPGERTGDGAFIQMSNVDESP